VDALRERKPPFSPEDVVGEFCGLLQSYGVTRVAGDKYAGEWPAERFKAHNIIYEPAQKPKSDLYRDLLPLINSRRIDLLDDARLINQLCSLERRVARGGRDSIDHPPGAHDDLANACAGAAVHLGALLDHTNLDWIGADDADIGLSPRAVSIAEKREYAMQQMRAYVWSGGGTRPWWSY